jgi:hypothetical protein
MRGFCANIFAPKKVQTLNLSTKKFQAKLLYEKAARKMLVKSTTACHSTLIITTTNCVHIKFFDKKIPFLANNVS